MKFKKIYSQGKLFLIRIAFYRPWGSWKFHIILNDDADEPHSHPWDFTSFILFGGYKEECDGNIKNYRTFSLNKKCYHEKHKTKLFRLFGRKIPAITIGKYGKKQTLCSFCQSIGICRMTGKPI